MWRSDGVETRASVCLSGNMTIDPEQYRSFSGRSRIPMGKRIVIATLVLVAVCAICGSGFGQDAAKPFTKQEISRLLKPTPRQRDEQGDLAAEIEQRGNAFPVDEKTLDELRK